MAIILEDTGRPEGLVVTQTAPATEPCTVAEVKNFMKIDYTTDDALIGELITAAREWVENYTGRAMVSRTITATWTRHGKVMWLPFQPAISITSVKHVLSDNTKDTLTVDEDYFVKGSTTVQIHLPASSNGLEIIYTAGYTSVPKTLKIAVMRVVANYYEHREDTIVGTISSEIEAGTKKLVKQFIVPVI